MTAPASAAGPVAAPREAIRLDKWLWQARFFKTRSLAATMVQSGRVRVNGTPVSKSARSVGAQDVLTFALAGRVRVIRILACGNRRGPASEAQALYEDLSEPAAAVDLAPGWDGPGRPDKRSRRQAAKHGPGALE